MGLNLTAGETVSQHQARALFQDQADPVTGEALGRPIMAKQQSPEGARTPSGQQAKSVRQLGRSGSAQSGHLPTLGVSWTLNHPGILGDWSVLGSEE